MLLLCGTLLGTIRSAQGYGCTGADQHGRCGGGGGVDGGGCQRGVEAAGIPEVRLGAAEAAVAGLDREAGAAVPLGGGAGIVGGWSLAAQLIQTPAVACAFIVEGLGKLALFVEGAAVAAVVDGLAVEGLGSAQFVQRGQLAEGEV